MISWQRLGKRLSLFLGLFACMGQAGAPAASSPTPPNPRVETPESPADTAMQMAVNRNDASAPAIGSAKAAMMMPNFADLAARVMPAVVSIQTEQRVRLPGMGTGADPFGFFQYFGQEVPREFENRGLGSGFLIDADGLILTNQHVIDKADTITVTFAQADGSERVVPAKVVGEAAEYDVALLKTLPEMPHGAPGSAANTAIAPSVPMRLGDSTAMRIGDWVMAVGNPFGLDHSVSVGIISARDRRDVSPSGRKGFYDFLQTDASINPGNSGGPLINLNGEVIGINAAINAQGQGIGFAIPINMVKEMLPQLKQEGRFTRSWLGVHIQALSPELASSFGLPSARGALIAEVLPDSPASQADLRPGDVVLEFDHKKLNKISDLQLFTSLAGAGKRILLEIWRASHTLQVWVTLTALPTPEEVPNNRQVPRNEANASASLGLTIADIPHPLRQQMGLKENGGVLVQMVAPGGLAQKSGLSRGDVILNLNNVAVLNAHGFIKQIKDLPSGSLVRLQIWRQGHKNFVALKT